MSGVTREQAEAWTNLYYTSPLSNEPNIPIIEEWMRDTYLERWSNRTTWKGVVG